MDGKNLVPSHEDKIKRNEHDYGEINVINTHNRASF